MVTSVAGAGGSICGRDDRVAERLRMSKRHEAGMETYGYDPSPRAINQSARRSAVSVDEEEVGLDMNEVAVIITLESTRSELILDPCALV